MSSAVSRALDLILTGDPELLNILSTTARMSLASSLIALVIGVPLLATLFGVMRYLIRALGTLTGLDNDRLLMH